MKKLMIAAAIVCAAVASQAATAAWAVTGNNIYLSDGSTKYAGNAYIFDAKTGSMADVYKAFVANTAVDLTTLAGYQTTVSVSEGAINATPSFGTTGTAYDLYFAIVNGDEMYFSQSIPTAGSDVQTSLLYGTQGKDKSKLAALETNDSPTAQRWNTPAAVPEPTSGLLLLLGVAGMALRRRRA